MGVNSKMKMSIAPYSWTQTFSPMQPNQVTYKIPVTYNTCLHIGMHPS